MTKILAIDFNTRLIACVGAVLLLMLVVGAGEISGNMQERIEKRQIERTEWSNVAVQMFGHMDVDRQTIWNTIAKENPQMLLQACTVEFKRVASNSLAN